MIIYPKAKIIKKNNKYGQRGDICDDCFISSEINIGDNVHIAVGCKIIGKGKVTIGDESSLAPGVVIYTSMPNTKKSKNKFCKNHEPIIKNVTIGKNVLVGSNSVIGCGAIIPDNSIVPPLTNIKPNQTYKKK